MSAIAAVAAVVLVVLGPGGPARRGPVSARVVRVVDGDTVKVTVPGGQETVRYIGMDTPESVKPHTPVQCYAKAASRRNAGLIGGQDVTLRFDAEQRDRYGRLLAYVYRRRDGLFVNAALVREGYARRFPFPPNTAHAAELARLQQSARRGRRGLWHACAGRFG